MKILYVEQSGIGNALLAYPLFQILKEQSDCELWVLAWNRSKQILEPCPHIDQLRVVEELNKFPIFDYTLISPVGAITHGIERISKKIITNPITPPWTIHEKDAKLQLAEKMSLKPDYGLIPRLYFSEDNLEAARYLLDQYKLINQWGEYENYVLINPSYLKSDHWILKHWGNDNYIKLIDKIIYTLDCENVFLIGDKTDKHAQEISEKTRAINLCGHFDNIMGVAALILDSSCLIGNDGALSHIAAAATADNVTIFTFTSTIKNAPLGRWSHVVTKDPSCPNRPTCQHGNYHKCQCLDVPFETVWQAVQKVL